MGYQSIISQPGTIPNPDNQSGAHYRSIVPTLPNPQVVNSRQNEQAQLKQQFQAKPSLLSRFGTATKGAVLPDHNRLAGIENFVKSVPSDLFKANVAMVKPLADVATNKWGQATHDTAQLTSDVTGGTVNQFARGVQRTPQMIAADITNNPKAQESTQKKAFGTTKSSDIAKKIVGSTVGTGSLFIGGGEAAGLKGAASASKATIAKSSLKLGTAGAFGNTAATITQNPNASKKQLIESAVLGGAAGAALPVAVKGIGKLISGKVPAETPSVKTATKSPVEPNKPDIPAGTASKVSKLPIKMAPRDEAGSVDLGGVQDMIQKHQASTKFTGDLQKNFSQLEGSKAVIAEDAAKTIKARQPLANTDKQTLQDYRDAKAAGLTPKPLPDHLVAEDKAVTELNKATQAHDAELARLNGQEAKAQAIEARDPSTYTHREAQSKGTALDYVAQGSRKNPLSVGGLGKTTPSSKARVFHAVTDEQGNRRVVAIKNSVLKDEQGRKIAQGKLVQAIDNGNNENLGKLKLNTNQDFLDKELKPYQSKIKSLQKEGDALAKVKTKGGVSDARITALAQKASLLEDPSNMTTLTRSEAKSLSGAKLKLRELTNIKPTKTSAEARLKTINQHLIKMNNDVAEIHAKYDPENLDKKIFVGKDGKKYTIGQATTSEITKATGQKYYTDPKLMALKNYSESRTALENARFIDSIKQHPDFSSFASEPGHTAPKGWQGVNGLDQFRGYKFEPKTAEVLRDIVKNSGGDEKKLLDQAGKLLRATIVYFPLKHSLNEGVTYAVDRGLSSLANPMAYKRGAQSLVKAFHDVTNQSADFQAAQKAGLHTVTGGDKALQEAFQKELKNLAGNERTIADVAKQWGTTPVRLYKAVQNITVWELQDILNMARVNERMAPKLIGKGDSLENAVAKTQRFNLQYSVPSRVGPRFLPGRVQRGLANTLSSPKVFFGRYRYDLYRILANTIKDTVNLKTLAKGGKQNAQALDKLAALALGTAVVWPLVDKGIQKITNNKNAYMKAPGALELPSEAKDLKQSKKTPGTVISNQLYLSGALTVPLDVKNNRDSFTGKQIYDPNTSGSQQVKDILNWSKGQTAPAQQAKQVKDSGGNKVVATLLSLASARFPKNSPEINKINSLKFDTLPNVQTNAKVLAAKGDTGGAINAIKQYDDQVLEATKVALKSSGQSIPDDATLKKNLTKAGYYYNPSVTTVQGWNSSPKTQGTLDKILNPTTSSGRRRTSGRTSSQKILP